MAPEMERVKADLILIAVLYPTNNALKQIRERLGQLRAAFDNALEIALKSKSLLPSIEIAINKAVS